MVSVDAPQHALLPALIREQVVSFQNLARKLLHTGHARPQAFVHQSSFSSGLGVIVRVEVGKHPCNCAGTSLFDRGVKLDGDLISQNVFIKSFCKNQFTYKFVTIFFISVISKDELTDLCGD